MNTNPLCQYCGKPLTAKAVDGLCPECLMKVGMGTGASAVGAFEPPSPAELGRFFPHLEILELLGRGGMGAVYKARQKELDRLVAVKILPPDVGSDPAFAQRFTREAKALAKLNHPNIVTLYEFGQSDGLFHFLMEFVDGATLRQLLNAGRVSPREALAIVPQICDALQFAHDQGIVHRDIKPENILLDRRGRVKVADFGLAKLVEASVALTSGGRGSDREPGAEDTLALTDVGRVMGTPQYMAPEQIESPNEVDHRADIYALGVVFYQMLTGELPGKRMEPPSKKVDVDVRLDEVVLRALEKEPQRRYQQASQVKGDVERIAGTTPWGSPTPHSGPASAPVLTETPRPPRLSRVAVAGAVWPLVVLLTTFFVVGVLRWILGFRGSFPGEGLLHAVPSAAVVVAAGTTILGGIALTQIRSSAGRLSGLGLALFDVLLFPLLLLDCFLGWSVYEMLDGLGSQLYLRQFATPGTAVVLTVFISLVTDSLLVWWAWYVAQRPVVETRSRDVPPRAHLTRIARRGVVALVLCLIGMGVVLPLGWLRVRFDLQLLSMVAEQRPTPHGVRLVLSPLFVVATWLLLYGFEIPALVLGILSRRTWVGTAAAILAGTALLLPLVYLGWESQESRRRVQVMAQVGVRTTPTFRARDVSFAPVIERVVRHNLPGPQSESMIDLDTGRLITPPTPRKADWDWVVANGIDAISDAGADVRGLLATGGTVVVPVARDAWDSFSPFDVRQIVVPLSSTCEGGVAMSGADELPAVFVFKTREDGMGVLQITRQTEAPPGVKIRYKLVQDTTGERNQP